MRKTTDHLEWCKKRAIQYVERGDLPQAWAIFTSDMNKHPETKKHHALEIGNRLFYSGELSGIKEMQDYINGFSFLIA